MKRIFLFVCCLLLISSNSYAVNIYDIELPETASVAGEKLFLNGYGLRKKYFFKVYLGSLYTAEKVNKTTQVINQQGGKLIRMDFIYSKVELHKIVGGFADGFKNNSPQLVGKDEAKKFLGLFNADFVEGDRVDLAIAADGTVSVTHNGQSLGSVTSPDLARGVLLIFLGQDPADEDMKEGMLGLD